MFPLLALAAAGFLLRSAERPLATPGRFQAEQWMTLAGRGVMPAMSGGLRAVVAGGFWLRANLAWEQREVSATTTWLELTVAADERPLYFWLNGARMLAYDMPEWLPPGAPAVVRQRENEAQAQRALAFLGKGLRWHGPAPELYVEMANIHLRRRGDLAQAALCYRLAAEQPGAPYYAARIHAELLLAQGRPREALAWLREILPGLPADEPAARRDVVLARIRQLEQQLAGR
jgi:hypothetical protein